MAICIKLLLILSGDGIVDVFSSAIPVLLFVPTEMRQPDILAKAGNIRSSLLGRGLCGTLSLLCYLLAIRAIPVSVVSLTSNTAPLFAGLAAHFFLGEALPRKMLWAFP